MPDIIDRPDAVVFVDWTVPSSSLEGRFVDLDLGCLLAYWHSVSKTRRSSFNSLGEIKLLGGGIALALSPYDRKSWPIVVQRDIYE